VPEDLAPVQAAEEPVTEPPFDAADLPETFFDTAEVAFDPLGDLPPPAEDLASPLPISGTTVTSDAFLNDPEDMDWGFDELADPDDAKALPEDVSALDASFDSLPASKNADIFIIPDGFVELGSEADKLDFPIEDIDLEKPPAKSEPRAKAQRAIKPESNELPKTVTKATRKHRPMPNLGQKLLRASAVLFLVSLIEIGLFFLLQLHLI